MSKLTTWEVLRAKFPAEEYVLIEEVADASGFSKSRSLDYMIVNLWQSRGLAVTGIEQKTNRGDWLKELKNPAKQENHFKYCDFFYLLTDKDNVAKIEEIPAAWGWYHINGNQVLKTMKPAPKLNPIPIGRSLLCAMMRRAADKKEFVRKDSLTEHIKAEAEKIHQDRNNTLESNSRNYLSLKASVDAFEQASGIGLEYIWGDNAKKMGEIVRTILNGGLENYIKRMKHLEESTEQMLKEIRSKVKLLSSVENPERSVATEDQSGNKNPAK